MERSLLQAEAELAQFDAYGRALEEARVSSAMESTIAPFSKLEQPGHRYPPSACPLTMLLACGQREALAAEPECPPVPTTYNCVYEPEHPEADWAGLVPKEALYRKKHIPTRTVGPRLKSPTTTGWATPAVPDLTRFMPLPTPCCTAQVLQHDPEAGITTDPSVSRYGVRFDTRRIVQRPEQVRCARVVRARKMVWSADRLLHHAALL